MSRTEESSTFSRQATSRELPKLIKAEDIARRIEELAADIRKDYSGADLTMLVVLKGAFVFAADLLRALDLPVKVEFIRAQSYGSGTVSSGQPIITYEPHNIAGQDILVVEDIVDTGLTLKCVKERLYELGAHSVRLCTLLDKPSRRKVDLQVDYTGFVVPDVFVAGYGIDYAHQHRELRDVCVIESEAAVEDTEE